MDRASKEDSKFSFSSSSFSLPRLISPEIDRRCRNRPLPPDSGQRRSKSAGNNAKTTDTWRYHPISSDPLTDQLTDWCSLRGIESWTPIKSPLVRILGVSCGGVAAVCAAVAEEGSGSIERETIVGRVQFIAGRNQDSWQRKIAASCDVDKLQRKITAGSFLPQRIAVGCDQRGWQPGVDVGNIVQRGIAAGRDQVAAGRDQVAAGCDQGRWQREMRAVVEGIREIGWLFWVWFGAVVLWSFSCNLVWF
ncbi:hypothetical protein B296_00029650 [Ensete ventricosum]|uniref:Uncharacterized protein n=1 Tax=Ensete ventricosum TaxID=4639 RepID=A0A426XBC6_ENSVE|nr:hypothetical protein B296_00029650 [Ensete ventricosum]